MWRTGRARDTFPVRGEARMRGISNRELDEVRALVERHRAIPAIVVSGIIERLDSLEQSPCPICGYNRAGEPSAR